MSTLSTASERLTYTDRRGRRRLASLRLRWRVLIHRERLDRLLIEGVDPVTVPELTLRAFQLGRLSHRTALAASLDDAVQSAPVRRRRSPSAPPLARDGIADAKDELAELSRALREEPLVTARGVALVRRLLTDGSGPLYVESESALRTAAGEARRALVTHS